MTHKHVIITRCDEQVAALEQQAFPRKRLVFNLQPFAIRERQALFQASKQASEQAMETCMRRRHSFCSVILYNTTTENSTQAYLETIVGLVGLPSSSPPPQLLQGNGANSSSNSLALFLELGRYLRLLSPNSIPPSAPPPSFPSSSSPMPIPSLPYLPLPLTSSEAGGDGGEPKVSLRDFELVKVRTRARATTPVDKQTNTHHPQCIY